MWKGIRKLYHAEQDLIRHPSLTSAWTRTAAQLSLSYRRIRRGASHLKLEVSTRRGTRLSNSWNTQKHKTRLTASFVDISRRRNPVSRPGTRTGSMVPGTSNTTGALQTILFRFRSTPRIALRKSGVLSPRRSILNVEKAFYEIDESWQPMWKFFCYVRSKRSRSGVMEGTPYPRTEATSWQKQSTRRKIARIT